MNFVWKKNFPMFFHFRPWAKKQILLVCHKTPKFSKLNSTCRKEHIKKMFFLKTYLKNPTNDLIKFKILTNFYLLGCQTCIPIVRRNVPKKRRFFKMWIFCQPLGHWANYFRSLGENFSAVSLKLHFRCAGAPYEEKNPVNQRGKGYYKEMQKVICAQQ